MILKLHVNEVPVAENPHGVDARRIHDSAHAQVVHIDLKPGESLRRHATPVDVCFYVLAGTGRVHIGDEHVEVGADTLVESPANIPHFLSNSGSEPFRVLVIKTPRPQKKTRLL
jgi:mannose-6-phosphate isomerase-like protein (cupin superfamily)